MIPLTHLRLTEPFLWYDLLSLAFKYYIDSEKIVLFMHLAFSLLSPCATLLFSVEISKSMIRVLTPQSRDCYLTL